MGGARSPAKLARASRANITAVYFMEWKRRDLKSSAASASSLGSLKECISSRAWLPTLGYSPSSSPIPFWGHSCSWPSKVALRKCTRKPSPLPSIRRRQKKPAHVQHVPNVTANYTFAAELRSQTVENIWEITVSLNILYKENWTRLAAQEIARYQDQLVQRVAADMALQFNSGNSDKPSSTDSPAEITGAVRIPMDEYEWTFAKAFLYSLTVLTTIGYGNVAPRTSVGKAVTMGYALLGIPLTLLYLSVVGSLLSKLIRSVFSRVFCCCICTGCGYCCYDQSSIENSIRKKYPGRPDHLDYNNQMISLQEPYYVRSPSGTIISAAQAQHASMSSMKDRSFSFLKDCDSLSCETDPKHTFHPLSILAPACLCIALMASYVLLGALILYQMEGWPMLDGIFFCFMCLSTVGFGNLVPGAHSNFNNNADATVWFCSIYIISGLALTAMCFNVLHDEIIHRIHHHERIARMNTHKNSDLVLHHQS